MAHFIFQNFIIELFCQICQQIKCMHIIVINNYYITIIVDLNVNTGLLIASYLLVLVLVLIVLHKNDFSTECLWLLFDMVKYFSLLVTISTSFLFSLLIL